MLCHIMKIVAAVLCVVLTLFVGVILVRMVRTVIAGPGDHKDKHGK